MYDYLRVFDVFDDMLEYFSNSDQLTTDFKTEEDKHILLIEVPGLTEEQINIEYKDNVLAVTANYIDGIRKGEYKNRWRISNIDPELIDAKLEKGVLTISIPKSVKEQAKKIQINKPQ